MYRVVTVIVSGSVAAAATAAASGRVLLRAEPSNVNASRPELKPIYDPPEDEREQSEYTFVPDDEMPPVLVSPVRLLRQGVDTVSGVVKYNVETAQGAIKVVQRVTAAVQTLVTDVSEGRRQLLFGDTLLPSAFFLLAVGMGTSMVARRSNRFVLKWLLTPTATLVTFRLCFPNTYERAVTRIENDLGVTRPTARGTLDKLRSSAGELVRNIRHNRSEAKSEVRGGLTEPAPVPMIETEEPINEAVAFSTNPETQTVVLLDSHFFSEPDAPDASDNDLMDMYTVRSTNIGGSEPSESPHQP